MRSLCNRECTLTRVSQEMIGFPCRAFVSRSFPTNFVNFDSWHRCFETLVIAISNVKLECLISRTVNRHYGAI